LFFVAALSPVRGQGYAPGEAVRRMTAAADVEVQLVACEPMIRQPVAMTFDERGRLWVIQYLQYPNPAGLKRVAVDRYSRTVYDRVPKPPPRGPRGADRITILEDDDGDGRVDRGHDFVAGLNLATGLLHGYGGLFVVQAPYLLFYADRDRDDRPDGDPEVLLSGFGIEDAHAVANSLAWGPDGWLYGAQGSTVTANIRGTSFQQGIWRYHPRTREFELFAEGGGNTWGLDFDRHGNLLAGTNVGGYALLHQVQGGYYWKSFGKHGALHNPYAFGYLEHVPYRDFRGGHVTCGGIVYQGNSLPERYRDRYIAANLLSHAVYWHELAVSGSSFTARHGGELLAANDTWFAPVDLAVAPDGSLLVADWHDQRTAHPDPDADWDRTNGRVYRIQSPHAAKLGKFDLASLSSSQLMELLAANSGWHRATARRLLIERHDASLAEVLRERAVNGRDDRALEYLWTLHGLGGLDESTAGALLNNPNEYVRAWVIRLAGDRRRLSDALAEPISALAASDPSPVVRAQLASTAARLPAEQARPIINGLVRHDEDADDRQIPMLVWWAIERQLADPGPIVDLLASPDSWRRRLLREHLIGRIARRLMASGGDEDARQCARLFDRAPCAESLALVIGGMNEGLRGQPVRRIPVIENVVRKAWTKREPDLDLIELGLRLQLAEAGELASRRAVDRARAEGERCRLIEMLGETEYAKAVAAILKIFEQSAQSDGLRAACLNALAHFDEPAIARRLLACHGALSPALQTRVIDVLCQRRSSAAALVDAVAKGRIAITAVSVDQLRRVAAHHDSGLDAQITRLWGHLRDATPEEKLATARRLNNDLRAAPGDPAAGRELFRKHCAICHRLYGEGNNVGPDLTTANRGDRDFLLLSLVDPSAQVRKEYLSYNLQTRDGRVLTGIVVDEGSSAITVIDARNERSTIARGDLELIEPSPQSLMPEGLVEKLSPGELRDLFGYLQSPGPVASAE
jgi:putative membrane-bound dehydrogenase-like protein